MPPYSNIYHSANLCERIIFYCLPEQKAVRAVVSFLCRHQSQRIYPYRPLPKALAQMQHQAGKELNQVQIAYASGYADQSHFIRDFKKFCGYTPMSLLKYQIHIPICSPIPCKCPVCSIRVQTLLLLLPPDSLNENSIKYERSKSPRNQPGIRL